MRLVIPSLPAATPSLATESESGQRGSGTLAMGVTGAVASRGQPSMHGGETGSRSVQIEQRSGTGTREVPAIAGESPAGNIVGDVLRPNEGSAWRIDVKIT